MVYLFALLGAFTYRWRGSGWPDLIPFTTKKFPHTLRRASFALVFAFASVPLLEWWAFAIPFLCWFGLVVGHGSYFPSAQYNIDNERFAFLTRLVAHPMNNQARMFGMGLTGVAMTFPVGALVGVISRDITLAGIVALSGLVKPVIYWLCWAVARRWQYTAIAEYLFGAAICSILAATS